MNPNANTPDLKMVADGIPYLPFPNRPLKNMEKYNTTHKQHIISATPAPLSLILACRKPASPTAKAVKLTSKIVVPGMKIGDSLNVNLPEFIFFWSSPSSSVAWFFCVTSKAVPDKPMSFRTMLKQANSHDDVQFILAIRWLFHQARADKPVLRYSDSVYKL